jgi:hypothetical protein
MQGLLFTDNGRNAFIGFKEFTGAAGATYGESVHFSISDFSASDPGSGFWWGTSSDNANGVTSPLLFLRSNGNFNLGYGADQGFRMAVNGTAFATSDFRAPQFIDSNDTSFFIDAASTSTVNTMRFGGSISTNTSNGARILGMKSESGKYFTQNAFGQDGGYTWPSTTYVTSNSNSAIGNTTFRGNGIFQGHTGPEFVPIDATKTYRVSVWMRTVSGSPLCYLSHRQYFWDYSPGNPGNGGWGNPYWFASVPPTSWTEYTMTIGPAGSGADYTHMAGVKFVRHGWLHNYTSDPGAIAEFQGWKIEEVDSRLANNTIVLGDLYAGRFIDTNDNSFLADPNGTSRFSILTLTSTFNLPNNALISVNGEPDTWGARLRTTTATTRLGSALKNIIWTGGGTSEGFAVSGVGTGGAAFEVRNDGAVWARSNFRAPEIWGDSFYDDDGTFFFRTGVTTGNTRHINLANSNSDPSSVGSSTGISSGARGDNLPYYLMYVKSPYNNGFNTYTRLSLGWHTGVEIGGNPAYGGVRFMNDSPGISTTELMGVGVGDQNVRIANTLLVPYIADRDNTGFYADLNSTGNSINIAGSLRAANFNRPAILSVSSGTSSSGGSLAIQQETAEGWTGIFVDYEPFTGWGLWHDNPNNFFSFTSEGSTGGIRSFTVPSRVSGNRTAFEKFRVDQNNGNIIVGGIGTAQGDFRAPIFYDSNDTNFYADPNSLSRLAILRIPSATSGYSLMLGPETTGINGVTHVMNDSNRFSLQVNAPFYPHIGIGSTSNSGNTTHGPVLSFQGWRTAGGYRRFVMGIANQNPNELSFGWEDNFDNPHYGVGINWSYPASVWYDTGHNWYARGSSRAPIFYDQNDTGRYVDPNGESRLNGTRIYPTLATGRGVYSQPLANLILEATAANPSGYANIEFLSNFNYPSDGASITYFTGIDGGEASQLRIQLNNDFNDGISLRGGYIDFEVQTVDGQSQGFRNNVFRWLRYGTEIAFLNSNGVFQANGDSRAPIFYDSNDTTYFLNPNGDTSGYFRGMLRIGGGGWSGGNYNENLRLIDATNGFSVIVFGASGDTGPGRFSILKNPSDNWTIRNSGNSEILTIDQSGNHFNYSSVRSPIFYDQNNTGFFVDPNGSSRTNEFLAYKMRGDTNGIYTDNSGWWAHDVYGQGWGKPHGSFRSLEVSTSGNFSTEPAMFRIHQWGSGSAEFWKPQGTTLFLRETPLSFGGSIKHGNWFTRFYVQRFIETDEDMRAPIFYDHNNTGRYMDPTGQSYIVNLCVGENNYNHAYPGVLQIGSTSYNYNFLNGSWAGAITCGILANCADEWEFMIHDSGARVASFFIFQSGPNRFLMGRSTLWDQTYVEAAASFRAPIFYDSNNTGYYVDPNGTSRIGGIQINAANPIQNEIRFYGVTGDEPGSYNHTGIFERIWRSGDESELLIFKGNDPDTSTIHDRVRIAATGRVVFHSWNTYGTIDAYMGAVGGNINGSGFFNGNDLYVTGNVIAYFSDERLKDIIGTIPNALDKIMSLRGFYYTNNETAKECGYTDDSVQLGLSAQAVQKVCPEVVTAAGFDVEADGNSISGEDYLTVQYDRLIPVLVEAIKELKGELDDARNEIKQLRQELLKK